MLAKNPEVFRRFNTLCKCMKWKSLPLDGSTSSHRVSKFGNSSRDTIPLVHARHVCRFRVQFAKDVVLVIVRYLYIGELSLDLSFFADKDGFLYRLLVASDYLFASIVFDYALSEISTTTYSVSNFYTLLGLHDDDLLISQVNRANLLSTLSAMFVSIAETVVRSKDFSTIGFANLHVFLTLWLLDEKLKFLNRSEIIARWNAFYDKSTAHLNVLATLLSPLDSILACNSEFFLTSTHFKLRFHDLGHVKVTIQGESLFPIEQTCHEGIYKVFDSYIASNPKSVDIDIQNEDDRMTLFHGLDIIHVFALSVKPQVLSIKGTSVVEFIDLDF